MDMTMESMHLLLRTEPNIIAMMTMMAPTLTLKTHS
jgi:hypothetical protein